jgi:Na+/melibiose symporter-like transporter
MLFRILGQAVVGLLIAGLVAAVVIPVAAQLGYQTGPWVVAVISCLAIAASVVGGERRHRRRARDSS